MRKIYWIYYLIIVLDFLPLANLHAQAALNDNATLDDYVNYALENNPLLQAYGDLHEAVKEIPSQQRALPEPTISFGYFAQNPETRVGPQEQVWTIQQKIPFFGKLSLKGQMAEQDALIAGKTYEEKRLILVQNVKYAYFDYFRAHNLIKVTEEERKILTHMQEIAQVKYASGLVGQQDVLKAQLSLSRVEDELKKLEQAYVTAKSTLNRLLNREPGAHLAVPRTDVKEVALEKLEHYHELAEARRPELSSAELAEEKALKAKALAKRRYFPDLALSMQYFRVGERPEAGLPDNGKDALLFSVSVNLPVWFQKTGAGVKEAGARIALAKHRKEALQSRIRSEVQDAYVRVQTAGDRVALIRDAMILQAEQTFRASESGYQTGKIDFLEFLDSERMLLGVRKMYYDSLTDLGKEIAHFERVVGMNLHELGI